MDHTEPVTKGSRKKSGPGRRPYKGKPWQIQSYGSGCRAFTDHNVYGKVLHSRVQYLFHLPVQPVDLINKQDITFREAVQYSGHLARFFYGRTAGSLDIYPHLVGYYTGKRGLPQSRGPVEKGMIQGIMSALCRFYIYLQGLSDFFLPYIIRKLLWP